MGGLFAVTFVALWLAAPAAGMRCAGTRPPHRRIGVVASAAPSIALRDDLDAAIALRGKKERSFLQEGTELLAVKQRGGGGGPAGFGGSARALPPKPAAKKQKKRKQASSASSSAPSALLKELKSAGVVRIDGALSEATADALRAFVDDERARCDAEVASGDFAAADRFADLVLVAKRCDLLMPLRGPSIDALDELVGEGSVIGPLVQELMGDAAVLQEIACLISEPGSEQQPLHPDTPHTKVPPLFAAFVALQDVDVEMGPTVYLPGTHTAAAHTTFYGGDLASGRDTSGLRTAPVAEDFLRAAPVKLGTLRKGDVALYNQQVLHCGSANRSERVRRQFYVSWRNPAVAVKARASIRPALRNRLTLGEVRAELRALNAGGAGAGRFAELNAADEAGERGGA